MWDETEPPPGADYTRKKIGNTSRSYVTGPCEGMESGEIRNRSVKCILQYLKARDKDNQGLIWIIIYFRNKPKTCETYVRHYLGLNSSKFNQVLQQEHENVTSQLFRGTLKLFFRFMNSSPKSPEIGKIGHRWLEFKVKKYLQCPFKEFLPTEGPENKQQTNIKLRGDITHQIIIITM